MVVGVPGVILVWKNEKTCVNSQHRHRSVTNVLHEHLRPTSVPEMRVHVVAFLSGERKICCERNIRGSPLAGFLQALTFDG